MNALIQPYKETLPEIAGDAFIAANAVIIGDVKIGTQSSIWYGCTLRGDVNRIRIGARSNIQDHSMIHVSSFGHATIIGDDVTVGHMALLHACTLEDGSFVGMKACIMDGAVVEKGAMVAAGALVPPGKRVVSGQLWAGTPARFMRDLSEDDRKHMTWSAAHYVRLAQEYKAIN
ncbi:MAG: gamma carbonic anhydrase family protein [Rhodospirillales bacterium]|nr:gamma carbonic anhydrase family protein [Rhodospirillales bacterium]MCB9995533.1 gamma carbonic anhydrase family protein [Rhodospirillales bacterium]